MTNYKNWRTGLSTNNIDVDFLKQCAKAGISAIEYGPRFTNCDIIDWEKVKYNFAQADGVELYSYHLPFSRENDIGTYDEELRQFTLRNHFKLIEAAAKAGCKVIVVHPGGVPGPAEVREKEIYQNKTSLTRLADCAEEFGVKMTVEDMPRTDLGNTESEILRMIEDDKRVGVTFDVNHLLHTTHKSFVDMLGDRIVHTHISDYDFIDERHLMPGDGKIDWKELTELLENADYNGVWMYECGMNKVVDGKVVGKYALDTYRKIHMNIKNLPAIRNELVVK